MRSLALILAAALSFMLILIAFQNVTTSGTVTVLFGQLRTSLMLPLLLVSVIGMIAGALYAVSIRGMIDHAKRLEEEESEPDPF